MRKTQEPGVSSTYFAHTEASLDLPLYLDGVLLYLRIQADAYASLIPFLYPGRSEGSSHSTAWVSSRACVRIQSRSVSSALMRVATAMSKTSESRKEIQFSFARGSGTPASSTSPATIGIMRLFCATAWAI